MSSLSKIFGRENKTIFSYQDDFKKSFAKFEPTFSFCDNNTNVGIEIEVERVGNNSGVLESDNKMCYLWNNVEDGSLRNNGREFVSIPVKGSNIEFALTTLNSFLTKSKTTANHEFTDRTSVHVHVDFSTLAPEDLQSFMAVYIAVEPLLYAFVGGDRSENIFAVPLNETNMHDELLKALFEPKIANSTLDTVCRHWTKYTGINLVPVRTYNTVEFRHMVGTCNVRHLCNWINAILQLRLYAIKNNLETVLRRLTDMNTVSDYGAFINEVFYYDDHLLRAINVNLDKELENTTTFLKSIKVKKSIPKEIIDFKGTLFEKLQIVRKAGEESAMARKMAGLRNAAGVQWQIDPNAWANVVNGGEIPEPPPIRRGQVNEADAEEVVVPAQRARFDFPVIDI